MDSTDIELNIFVEKLNELSEIGDVILISDPDEKYSGNKEITVEFDAGCMISLSSQHLSFYSEYFETQIKRWTKSPITLVVKNKIRTLHIFAFWLFKRRFIRKMPMNELLELSKLTSQIGCDCLAFDLNDKINKMSSREVLGSELILDLLETGVYVGKGMGILLSHFANSSFSDEQLKKVIPYYERYGCGFVKVSHMKSWCNIKQLSEIIDKHIIKESSEASTSGKMHQIKELLEYYKSKNELSVRLILLESLIREPFSTSRFSEIVKTSIATLPITYIKGEDDEI